MKSLLCFLLLAFYSLTAWSVCDGNERIFTLTDPTDQQAWNLSSFVYKPLIVPGSPTPVVFILPPIIGANDLDRSLAIRFCLNGMSAYILNTIKDDPEDVEVYNLNTHNEALQRAHAGVRAAIDELARDPGNGNFGILGASLGGIQAAYIAGIEPMIKSSVVLAGAGNIPGVLAYSDQERAVRVREARMQLLQMNDPAQYESLMSLFTTEDPLNVASAVPPDSMYFFVVLRDTSVPTIYQQQLVERIPAPKVQEIDATHILGIAGAGTSFAEEITRFLKERL
ncbi:MAG TPA: hypothetical protein VNJ08_17030 [Bacteriovoracaceae bacterium]|nr:hypothetical protein [Bacteriovoracaceae bacterium]